MQNFGKIKNIFNGILAEGVVSKSETNKQLFKKYVQSIKENKILRTQFLVYNNIENKCELDTFKASQYVQENLDLLKKFDTKSIEKANKKLLESLTEEQLKLEGIDTPLYDNISKLIFTDKKAENVDAIVEAMSAVVDYVKANKKESIDESELTFVEQANGLPLTMVESLAVDRFNQKYADLNESDKVILKALIDSDDNKKKEVYSNTLQECLTLVNEKLTSSDLETKERLLRVKEKLLNDKQVVDENFITSISKLVELRNNLKEN